MKNNNGRRRKRLVASLLTFTLLLALTPASALAATADLGEGTAGVALTDAGSHTVTVQTDGFYLLECWGQKGANGGSHINAGGGGGNGGYVKVEAYLTAGTVLTVSVGVGGAEGGGWVYLSDSQGGKGGGRTEIQLSGNYLLVANGGGGGGGGSNNGKGGDGGTTGAAATGPADGDNRGAGSYGGGGGGGGAGYPNGGRGGNNNTGNGGPGAGGGAGMSYLAAASATLFPKTLTYGASSSATGEARIEWIGNCVVTLAAGADGTNGSATTIGGLTALTGITAPVKTGYAVEGYYDDANFSHKVAEASGALLANVSGYTDAAGKWIMTSDTTLYAQWTPKTYAVTLNPNGGSGGVASVTATYDAALPAFTAPTRTGCTLEGYYTAATGGTKIIDASGSLIAGVSGYTDVGGMWTKDGDVTLYAHWTYNLTASVALPSGDNAADAGQPGKSDTKYLLVTFTHPDVTVAGFKAATIADSAGASVSGAATIGTVTDNGDADDKTWRVNIFPTLNYGTAALAINGWTAANGNAYTVTITNPDPASFTVYKVMPEEKPDAAIDYVNERLTGLTAEAKYKIDGTELVAQNDDGDGYIAIESSWMDDAVHSIVKAGGTASVDSPAQTLTIPARPAAPAITPTQPETSGGSGALAGLVSGMEISADATTYSAWDTTTTEFSAGTYLIRVAATGTSFRSEAARAVIHAYGVIDFGDVYEGYGTDESYGTVAGETLTNGTGTAASAVLTDMTGAPFSISDPALSGQETTVTPAAMLPAGTYTAKLRFQDSLSSDLGVFDLTFTVHKKVRITNVTASTTGAKDETNAITVTFADAVSLNYGDITVGGAAVKDASSKSSWDSTARTDYTIAVTPLTTHTTGDFITVNVDLSKLSGDYSYQTANNPGWATAQTTVTIPRAIEKAEAVTPIPGYSTSYIQFTLDHTKSPIDTDAIEANPGSVEIKVGDTPITPTKIYRVDNDMGYTFRAMITPTVGGAATISIPAFDVAAFDIYGDIIAGTQTGSIADAAFALDANGNNYLTDTDDAHQVLSAIDLRTGVTDAPPIYAAPELELRLSKEYDTWRVAEFYLDGKAYDVSEYIVDGEFQKFVFDGNDDDYTDLDDCLEITLPEGWTYDNGWHRISAVLTNAPPPSQTSASLASPLSAPSFTAYADAPVEYVQFLAKVYVDGLTPTYMLTVAGGTASPGTNVIGRYTECESVTITADPPPAGKVFDKWSQTSGAAISDLPSTSFGSFTMPASHVTIEALYRTSIYIDGNSSGGDDEKTDDTSEPELPAETKTPKLPFIDVTEGEDWFYDDVAWVYDRGLMIGTDDTTFEPQKPMTRAMLVTILYRYEQSSQPAVGSTAPAAPAVPASVETAFVDVPADQWYSEAVAWGAINGIVKGYGDGRFGPDDAITREQLAAVLYRYEQHSGKAPDDIA
ncbi:MAG: S-layer homology domain-containing protein, partial [Oscillospiraceae bacterium]|nr:S-layer homology domain-containing protein [Oscillospiraceae bacterium]